MISYLKGKIIFKLKDRIIIEVNDVGYAVFLSDNFLRTIKVGHIQEIFTYQHVKEDILALYGFKTLDELEFFNLLLTVSGIGPKSAIAILAIASLDDIKESIVRGDSHLLVQVSGVGKKTAERLILELKDKVYKMGGDYDLSGPAVLLDEIEALVALGYSNLEAREALKQVDNSVVDSSDRIRQALKKLSK